MIWVASVAVGGCNSMVFLVSTGLLRHPKHFVRTVLHSFLNLSFCHVDYEVGCRVDGDEQILVGDICIEAVKWWQILTRWHKIVNQVILFLGQFETFTSSKSMQSSPGLVHSTSSTRGKAWLRYLWSGSRRTTHCWWAYSHQRWTWMKDSQRFPLINL